MALIRRYIGRTIIAAPSDEVFETLLDPYIYKMIDSEFSTNLKIIHQFSETSCLFYLELFLDYNSCYDTQSDSIPLNLYTTKYEAMKPLQPLSESSLISPLPTETESI